MFLNSLKKVVKTLKMFLICNHLYTERKKNNLLKFVLRDRILCKKLLRVINQSVFYTSCSRAHSAVKVTSQGHGWFDKKTFLVVPAMQVGGY